MKQLSLVLLALVALTVIVTACGSPTPTPTLKPVPSPTLLPPTPVATATIVPLPPTPTLSPTATIVVTPTATSAPATPTRAAVAATAKPRATATPPRPPAPKGSILYHKIENGIDRMMNLDLDNKNNVTPLFDIGPVLDISEGTSAAPFAWSSDNSKIAYISTVGGGQSNSLKIYYRATNDRIGRVSSDAGGGLSSPTWSPDGKQVAYIRLSGNKLTWAINIINADGTNCNTNDNKQVCEVRTGSQSEQFRGGLSWSKSGLFTVGFNTTGANDVYKLDRYGSGLTNLSKNPGNNYAPAWSPDGKLIAFTSKRDGKEQIYVMNADGTGLRRVSQGGSRDYSPTWSPDGNWIAFASYRNAVADIFMMDTRGGNVTQLSTSGGDHPAWSR